MKNTKHEKRARRPQGKVGEAKTPILREIPRACVDERAARDFMERERWGAETRCPRCDGTLVYPILARATRERTGRWACRECYMRHRTWQFTVRTGTVMEDSRVPLRCWCHAFWRACSSKKGVAALQIKRETGLSYKSALFLMHRIREAMREVAPGKLMGEVEADETYVGGKPRYKGVSKRGRGTKKTPVFAMVQRNGEARAMPMPRVSSKNIVDAIRENVMVNQRVLTDDAPIYDFPERRGWVHETVKHSAGEYVRGTVHTNTVESFFSRVKRGMYGVFHSVSKKHLGRYVNGFTFLHNTRGVDDGERTRRAILGGSGKRLLYAEQVAGA